MRRPHLLLASALGPLACAAACSAGDPSRPVVPPPTNPPFQAEPASVYVAKVKNVLVGLPPTDAEIAAVSATGDPAQAQAALASLVDGWMKLPQYQQKMLRFFQLSFQQTQVSTTDFADQAFPRQAVVNQSIAPLLLQNATESFARTVLELNAEGKPLTEAMTTTRFMMTPALMELYGFFDAWRVNDAGKPYDRFAAANPNLTITAEAAQGPIPIAQSLDPSNPNYMHWYDPDVPTAGNYAPGCAMDPIVYPASALTLHWLLLGSLEGRTGAGGIKCAQYGGTAQAPQMQPSDFSTWKMVDIRQPSGSEPTTAFWDLPSLRTATEMVLVMPRVGFFSTPAFFANWQTNTSNQMRVTVNQALIVATGAQVDGTDPTMPSSTPGLDKTHASQAACSGCHQLLDPTRSILASTYSWNYHDRIGDTTDPQFAQQKGLFAFEGVVKPVKTISDFGATLASHPLFAQAWAQKLCYWANSQACETDDPEMQRVVGVFKASGYQWNALVRELLSSPLVTHASPTKTASTDGEVVAVERRDHLCAEWNDRFGLTDVCGLDATGKAQSKTVIPEIVSGLPSDGYGRGSVAPVLPNQPTLFYRAGTENVCEAIAALVVDAPSPPQGVKQWSSSKPDAAVADFVGLVMGLPPSDPRAAPAQALLAQHFKDAQRQGASASDALKSTFVVACLAPSSVSIGL